jgi:hypothetical protein
MQRMAVAVTSSLLINVINFLIGSLNIIQYETNIAMAFHV